MDDTTFISRRKLISNILTGGVATLLLLIFSFVDLKNELGIFKRQATSALINKIIIIVMSVLALAFIVVFVYAIIRYNMKKSSVEKIDKATETLNTMNIIPIILMLFICVDAFFFSPVQVSGRSMENTLHDNDLLITSHYSSEYNVGDIIIIKKEGTEDLIIKRVVAKEGDTVTVTSLGHVVINGYEIEATDYNNPEVMFNRVLGEGEYYCLGDHRTNSSDSRRYGIFEKDQICGKVLFSLSPLKFKLTQSNSYGN